MIAIFIPSTCPLLADVHRCLDRMNPHEIYLLRTSAGSRPLKTYREHAIVTL